MKDHIMSTRLYGKSQIMKIKLVNAFLLITGVMLNWAAAAEKHTARILTTDALRKYVAQFNSDDEELYINAIPNKDALAFLEKNIPLFECPDKEIERTCYFRWWTYRKHIKETPAGYVITEFLPDVPWSGIYNTINCPAAHHFYEGRWLHNQQYLNDYAVFWFRKGGNPRLYSFWAADAYYSRYLANKDARFLIDLLPDLVRNYEAWETGWDWHGNHIGQRTNGLFYIIDDRDGGEMSIGGHGFRPTLNSFMYGDAKAITAISRMAGKLEQAKLFEEKAARIKQLVQEKLWDKDTQFFKVLPDQGKKLRDVRELYGYTPWYFNLPDPGYEAGWKELMDPEGFYAPYGPTFAEQRHRDFKISYQGHECQWNGPSWPLATCSVLTALANLLNNYEQDVIGKKDYFETLRIYTRCHTLKREDGKVVPWIDENLNPYTGDWISRTRLKNWNNGTWDTGKGGKERGKDYNHSTYNDLIITGLIGLRPRADGVVEVNPLLPENTWDYFCLDNLLYHGHILTILWDMTGRKYGKGKGLTVFSDGKIIARARNLSRITSESARQIETAENTPSGAKESVTLSYTNPVWDGYLADPHVIFTNGYYYAYGTGRTDDGKQFPVLRSGDFASWQFVAGALQPLKTPALKDYWAPEVAERDGKYYLYYAGDMKMRVAVSDRPEGPFVDAGKLLFPELEFSIDGHPFFDPVSHKWYLFFAKDFFDQRPGTALAVVELADDMISTKGKTHTVIRAFSDWQIYQRNRHWYDRDWQAWHTIEGAAVVYRDGRYYCFYSGGNWQTPRYGVGCGVSDTITGPYVDPWSKDSASVLSTIPGKLIGPGHNSVILGPDNETYFMVYHSWNQQRTARQMCIDPIVWTQNGPKCYKPSRGTKAVRIPLSDSAKVEYNTDTDRDVD